MDWITFGWLIAGSIAYSVGKYVGRTREREMREAMRPVRLTLELSGETIGGVEIVGMRASDVPRAGREEGP